MSFERKLAAAGAVFVSAFLAGCGAGYRPVVTPTNPSGPQAQPASYVTVVSSPSAASPGVANIIDYSGDTILAQAPLGPGPLAFTLDQTGSNGFTFNSDGTVSDFPATKSLQANAVKVTTVPPTAQPFGFMAPSAALWATDLNSNEVDIFSGTQPAVFKLAVPVEPTPILVIGPTSAAQRNYAITQGAVSSPTACNTAPTSGPVGKADAIEVASDTISNKITLGKCPVFAVQTPDNQRVFVLNRGDDTISVINSQTNTLDNQCPPPAGCQNKSGQTYFSHPTLPLSTAGLAVSCPDPSKPATCTEPPNLSTANFQSVAGPVYAEYNIANNQLVVADYDGGTISIIDVSLDEYGNDSPTFGTTYTVKVGNGSAPNPASVTVLYDGSRAYTANQNDDTTGNGTGNGTVTIVNLSSHTVEKTLQVNGHPRTVVSTQNSEQGKVYVASPDSPYLTIVRTDQDIVDTTILVQGNVVDVRVSSPNATSGNADILSRTPGYGQPCNLSPQQLGTGTLSLAQCQAQSLPLP